MTETILIGFTGPKRAGKDTAAQTLRQCFAEYDEELYIGQTSFAEPLYNMLREFVGKKIDKLKNTDAKDTETIEPFGCTLRHMIQTLGTDWGRDCIHKDAWVMSIQRNIDEATEELPSNADAAIVLIPDVRFENEAEYVRTNGILIHITKDQTEHDPHESENGVHRDDDDLVIENQSTLDAFTQTVTQYGNGPVYQRINELIQASI